MESAHRFLEHGGYGPRPAVPGEYANLPYAVAGASSGEGWTWTAVASMVAVGLTASFLAFSSSTFAFGFAAAFTTFRATFFAAFTLTASFLVVGAAVALWRFTAALVVTLFAAAFFALNSR